MDKQDEQQSQNQNPLPMGSPPPQIDTKIHSLLSNQNNQMSVLMAKDHESPLLLENQGESERLRKQQDLNKTTDIFRRTTAVNVTSPGAASFNKEDNMSKLSHNFDEVVS